MPASRRAEDRKRDLYLVLRAAPSTGRERGMEREIEGERAREGGRKGWKAVINL